MAYIKKQLGDREEGALIQREFVAFV